MTTLHSSYGMHDIIQIVCVSTFETDPNGVRTSEREGGTCESKVGAYLCCCYLFSIC